MRRVFVLLALLAVASLVSVAWFWPPAWIGFLLVGPLVGLGLVDMTQKRQAIRRNFPVIGHGRYLFEMIRPELNQYFVESNTDGMPFNREERSLVYQRAKGQIDTLPFGTQRDLYKVGYEWMNHSIAPVTKSHPPRVTIGQTTCKQPYAASLMNISAMSFGSLSNRAVLALNTGAKLGGFAHNTGEGGLSPYHLQPGGDVIWQLGTGYFGARAKDGTFDVEKFAETAAHPNVKMVELKLSQGAKPGHGGILPAKKLTLEIAQIRGVPMGQDVLSPPAHTAFKTPTELIELLARMRERAGGKPVGMKLCVGKRRELLAIMKAMIETQLWPDYISVDGAEGGTGAAPLEFSNSLGTPLTEGLIFVHNALVGVNMRDKVRVFAAGKVICGFDIARLLAIGADAVYSARAMMMAIGCIQARQCNNNTCPVGVATQDPELVEGLVVEDKAPRAARFHKETIHSFMELLAASGLERPDQLRPWHIMRRVSTTDVRHYGELYGFLEPGALLASHVPPEYATAWAHADAKTFAAPERALSAVTAA